MEAKLKEKKSDTVFIYDAVPNGRCNVILGKDLTAKLILRADNKKSVITLRADNPRSLQHYNALFADAGFSQESAVSFDAVIVRWAQLLQLLNALERVGNREKDYLTALCQVLDVPCHKKSIDKMESICTEELMKRLSAFEEYKQYA